MNALSASPQGIIEQCIDEYTRPLCVILDDHFMVKSWSGDCTYYGFDEFDIGKDCRDSMLFLVGLNAQDSIYLRFIETPNARAAHVQLFNDSDGKTLILLDATEQRVNHALLQQKGNELSLMHDKQTKLIENLKRLEKEVEAKRRQAEKADQLKSQFIATMSHEFRTPLTSILGYASRLKQTCGLAPTPIKYLNSVERGAQHLLSLVENLLDHAQMESDNLSINPIATNVSDIFGQLMSIFTSLAEDKYLRFSVDISSEIPEFLLIDEMRFRQILVNLISNAIKYTDQGSVHVLANWVNDEITVRVKDTGNGIAESDQQRIFVAFEQLGMHLGTGLGLSITKHLVTAMGGQLVLTSRLEQGSCFEVCLPAKQVTLNTDAYQEALSQAPRDKKPLLSVLLVEDDPDVLQLLQCVFDDTECHTLLASNGSDAINTALSDSPDLILLDLNLPDITGIEVIKTLRNNHFDNPVFVQSAWVSTEHKARAMAVGCNEYLTKPLDIPRLMQLVSNYFIKHADFGMPAERYQQLYQRFLDSLPDKHKILQQLEINNSQYNWTCPARPELQYYAHRLAGSAEMYGFSSIGRTAKQLDQLLLDYDRLELRDSYTQLREKISSTIALLRHQIGQAISQG
jgi:signal transduction histidine kinase/DNA-binding NarL/FixJ family response regulator